MVWVKYFYTCSLLRISPCSVQRLETALQLHDVYFEPCIAANFNIVIQVKREVKKKRRQSAEVTTRRSEFSFLLVVLPNHNFWVQ